MERKIADVKRKAQDIGLSWRDSSPMGPSCLQIPRESKSKLAPRHAAKTFARLYQNSIADCVSKGTCDSA